MAGAWHCPEAGRSSTKSSSTAPPDDTIESSVLTVHRSLPVSGNPWAQAHVDRL